MRGTFGTTVQVGLALLCVLMIGPSAFAQVLPARQDRLEQWLDALREHEPGTIDPALETIGSCSISEWLWYYASHARGADDLLLELQRPFRQSHSQ